MKSIHNLKNVLVCAVVAGLCSVLIPAWSTANASCPSEIVSYWRLDELSGTTAFDFLSNYDGHLMPLGSEPTWTISGKVNGALSFDGTDDYVDCCDISELNNISAFTIVGWYKDNDIGGHNRHFDKGDGVANDISAATYSNKLYIEVGNGANTYAYWSDYSSVISTEVWYHAAFIFDGNGVTNSDKVKIYVDGVERALNFGGGDMPTTTADLTGYPFTLSKSSSNQWNGYMDEVAIFNRALSDVEVLDLYNRGLIGHAYCIPEETWVNDDWTCQADVNGFDPNLTWKYDAFDSIQDGIDAVAGSTVHVLAGTYTEAVTITPGVDLTIEGAGQDVTTWIAPADDPSRMHCIKCSNADDTTLDISGFTFSVEDNATSTSGIAISINRATNGPLYLSIHDNKFIETTTIADETANSMLLCHNRYAARGADAPVKIYNNLDYTTGGIAMSNSQAFDINDNVFDGGSDALYIGYGCPENTTIGDHHIYNNTFKNASSAYPSGPWPSIFFSYSGSGTGMTFLPSTIENNFFQDNDVAIGYEMESDITYPSDVIRHNSFEDCNDYAVQVWGTYATPVDAEYNWWGDASGPYDPAGTREVPPCCFPSVAEMKNADGLGDEVSENVDYCPWLTNLIFSGSGSGTKHDPYIITNVDQLQEINNNLDAYYILGNDIDASETTQWNSGAGFFPIGDVCHEFTGHFDGQGYKITGLYINRPSEWYIGLFGYTYRSKINNVGLIDADITGRYYIGALVGRQSSSSITNCYSTGSVRAGDYTNVKSVTNTKSVGGLVGYVQASSINSSYSTASVSAHYEVGGLVGQNWYGTINNCYATGPVNGDSEVGGLVGKNCEGIINNSYSVGNVVGTGDDIGGFVGFNSGTCNNCFWDTETSGQDTSACGTGKTTAEMQTESTFTSAGWDFVDVWTIEGIDYPKLVWQIPTTADIVATYIQGAIDEKVEALERINAAVEKEVAAVKALNELLVSGEFGDLTRRDVLKARRKIGRVIRGEELASQLLEQTIIELENALALLGCEVEP